jgi:hypothetical protein
MRSSRTVRIGQASADPGQAPVTSLEVSGGAALQRRSGGLVAGVAPVDAVEDGQRRTALAWLDTKSGRN